ncbi:hypothetical protein TTHERM_000186019 (macronuclear) [Tetrahymena thermophila SB210]|uniref:Uncharacterized protein n=1 Tax=Tetrahymena thermophila (strain SB210) TaxID=312017 RepID=W7XA03_TETTS|nr:hypothetical protein TTHERM_000186019 [Tetrahymena thermophila SB210]EWS76235.1 hypothetical protein TTHERM_000186019 [Tetrahymena thermophila SB210]|eukprot:XP_012651282.1 hypothetical protein TTHERM_000186019 [Tetrahymena thermophila SB210]
MINFVIIISSCQLNSALFCSNQGVIRKLQQSNDQQSNFLLEKLFCNLFQQQFGKILILFLQAQHLNQQHHFCTQSKSGLKHILWLQQIHQGDYLSLQENNLQLKQNGFAQSIKLS